MRWLQVTWKRRGKKQLVKYMHRCKFWKLYNWKVKFTTKDVSAFCNVTWPPCHDNTEHECKNTWGGMRGRKVGQNGSYEPHWKFSTNSWAHNTQGCTLSPWNGVYYTSWLNKRSESSNMHIGYVETSYHAQACPKPTCTTSSKYYYIYLIPAHVFLSSFFVLQSALIRKKFDSIFSIGLTPVCYTVVTDD